MDKWVYDELGRLISAATAGPEWGLSWTFDGFGNRLSQNVTKGSGPMVNLTVDAATNRISTSGFSFDANGNMTQWPLGGNAITGSYDVENRLVSAATDVYKYNAANQRVVIGNENADPRYSVYGLNGDLLGEYRKCSIGSGYYVPCNRSERVYFAGRYLQKDGNLVVADRLGTVGTAAGYPYGESRDEFATYRKDSATGLHYAWNRYYIATWGRFASADPYRATARAVNNPKVPQSWNRYAYGLNDPVNRVDPRGTNASGPRYVCLPQTDEGLSIDCHWEEPDDPNPGGPALIRVQIT